MDLVCEKYQQKMRAEKARCRHAKEYCKFRSSCMIHFLAREHGEESKEAQASGDGAGAAKQPMND